MDAYIMWLTGNQPQVLRVRQHTMTAISLGHPFDEVGIFVEV